MGWLIAAVLLIIATAAFLLRSAYERKQLSITEYDVSQETVPEAFDGFRIVFLSDLHDHRFGDKNEKLIGSIRELKPDLILFGGDMITVKTWNEGDFAVLRELLNALRDFTVCYANGNHEDRMAEETETYPGWYERFTELLKEYPNVQYLKNASARLSRGAERITVSGADLEKKYYGPVIKRKLRKEQIDALVGPAQDGYRILLLHSPLYLKESADWGADLTLSGHFHGGTVRLPLLGGLMTPQYQLFSRYCRGKFTFGNRVGIVSGGLGTHTFNFRFLNLPEVILIKLHKEK